MITDTEAIFAKGAPWPPKDDDTANRLKKYANNESLFMGEHGEVWKDEIRKLRADKSGDLRLVWNFFKRLSLLWSDLVCSEPPEVSTESDAEAEAIDRIIEDTNFWTVLSDAIIDVSKFGDAVLKIRYDGYGIVENVPPEYWFPVVDSGNVKRVKAHILAYTIDAREEPGLIDVETMVSAENQSFLPEATIKAWEKEKPISVGRVQYLKVEIHTVGRIEHRLYRIVDEKIDAQLDLNQLPEFRGMVAIEDTGLDDFCVQLIQNVTSTKRYHGMDDYLDIADIIRELEWRYAQILRIEDKFSDPWMFGPPIEEQDPRDGEYKITGGSKYINLVEGQSPPGMLTWNGELPANFVTIDSLMQRLFEISETCKVVFDASAGGQGLSAQALRIMLTAPLKKANRLQTRATPTVKRLLRLCSALEANAGMAGAVKLTDLKITWHDGLPVDEMADAQRDAVLVTGSVRSAQGLMRDRGMPEEKIVEEFGEMMNRV